jgi:hypothetical protein
MRNYLSIFKLKKYEEGEREREREVSPNSVLYIYLVEFCLIFYCVNSYDCVV